MGKLAGALSAGPQRNQGPECSVGAFLASLDDETRGEAVQILTDATWPHTQVTRVFTPLGLAPGRAPESVAATIARHRRGDCRCGSAR